MGGPGLLLSSLWASRVCTWTTPSCPTEVTPVETSDLGMPTKKTEYAIAGIRTYVYCSASDATPRLNSLPVAILFVLHGRNGSYGHMERVVDRLLGVQEAQPEQAKRELIVVAFVGDLSVKSLPPQLIALPGSQKPWRAPCRSCWEFGVEP
jgi:hypothetical protein